MRQHVPPQQLASNFQGDLEFEYDHAVYWPELMKLCDERLAEQKERWIKAGKHFGESEAYLKGGNVASVAAAPPLVVQEDSTAIPTIPGSNKENEPAAPVPAPPAVVATVPVAAGDKVTTATAV